jgi:cytosine/uracil/thiamine/allantoin permease
MFRKSFWRALIAVLAGNAVYFILEPHLPPPLRHHLYQIDLGLAFDFVICAAFYALLRFAFPPGGRR